MIPTPARQPQHCDHECFYKREILNQSCAIPRCEHDTRTTPHTSPPAPAPQCKHKNAYVKNGVKYCDDCMTAWKITHTSPTEPESDDALTAVYLKGKADGAKAAREQEQQRINAVIKELEHLRDGQYNDVVGHNVRYAYDYVIILLRAQQEQI